MPIYVFRLRSSLAFVSCALLVAACSSDSTDANTPGSGGADGKGGSNNTGGAATGSGGAIAASGGTTGSGGATMASGGAPATGGAGAAGSGGASGGATGDDGGGVPDGGTEPDSGTPREPSGCRTNQDCAAAPGKPLCDAKNDKCIACHTNAQCSEKEECVENGCVPRAPCKSSLDCAAEPGGKTICDKTNGVCVECTAASDCDDGEVCTERVCHKSCNSDNDCTALHMVCNRGFTFTDQCTECSASSDCGKGTYCEGGQCVPFTCTPAQQSCAQNNVVQCNDTGSDVIPQMQCTLNLLAPVCMLQKDNARCVGTCEDGKRDGLETDVDCGGPMCPRCEKGKACSVSGDCTSGKCTSGKCE